MVFVATVPTPAKALTNVAVGNDLTTTENSFTAPPTSNLNLYSPVWSSTNLVVLESVPEGCSACSNVFNPEATKSPEFPTLSTAVTLSFLTSCHTPLKSLVNLNATS